jgi:hypothetical protein
MNRKVERLAASVSDVLSSWPSVECVTLGEHSEADPLDPYFAVVVDAYLSDEPPEAQARQAAFAQALGQPGDFESSVSQSKDRFFIDGVPIRVEYKSSFMIEELVSKLMGPDAQSVWVFKNSGTYMFYRLLNSRSLFERGDWLMRVRRDIQNLPATFWRDLRDAFLVKMEHYLSDLGAAALSADSYFYNVSLAGFTRYVAASLFMANKRFEPSHRYTSRQLVQLKKLPEDFVGRWETLLRSDIDISTAQKYEVAQLIARSLLAFR